MPSKLKSAKMNAECLKASVQDARSEKTMSEGTTMKTWEYKEITKRARAQIKGFMGMSREMPTVEEAKGFSDIAFGVYFFWYMMVRPEPDHQKAMKRDNARLLKLAGRSPDWRTQHIEINVSPK